MERNHNQRKHDGKLGYVGAVATIITSLYAGIIWLNSHIVTTDELERQRYYTDYQIARLQLQIATRAIERAESQIDAGQPLTPSEQRQYKQLIEDYQTLKKEVERLASIF